jgi:hypothetical protein
MAEQELDLFQLASGNMTQPGARATKIVRRELGNAQLWCILLDNVPHDRLRDAVTPCFARFTDASKHPSKGNASRAGPLINQLFGPVRNRNGSNVSTFSYEIYDSPVFIAPLQVAEILIG